MEIPDHSLPQITPEVLGKLNPDELLKLAMKLLKDLKELRDRLNQNSNNSSRPSSSIPLWEKDSYSNNAADEYTENQSSALEESQANEENKKNKKSSPVNEMNFSNLSTGIKTLTASSQEDKNIEKPTPKKPGKQKGAPGYGRTWNPEVTEEAIHCSLDTCIVCNFSLGQINKVPYTQYNQGVLLIPDVLNWILWYCAV